MCIKEAIKKGVLLKIETECCKISQQKVKCHICIQINNHSKMTKWPQLE